MTAPAPKPVPAPPSSQWLASQRAAELDSLRIRRMNAIQAGVRAEWEFVMITREWEAERRAALGLNDVQEDDYAA